MMVDLGSGRQIKKLTHYALRHDVTAGIQNGQLRNWDLQAAFKKEGPWTTLRCAQPHRQCLRASTRASLGPPTLITFEWGAAVVQEAQE